MELTFLIGLGLLMTRVGAVVLAAPVFGGTYAPQITKIGLALLLAFALLPVVPVPSGLTLGGLGGVVAREVLIGLAIALAVRILMGAAELGGHVAGFQLGLGYAATIDPTSGVRSNTVATLYSNLTLLTFFGLNGHHLVLKALVASYDRLPVGSGSFAPSIVQSVTGILGTVFVVGAQLAAPVVVVMLLVELSLGLVERAAAGADVFMFAPPTRVLVGMVALSAAVAAVPEAAQRFLTRAFELSMSLALGLR
ncbi:MAG: flagellar biosynthetic protein FliR [Vicinamibacterales bacterium]